MNLTTGRSPIASSPLSHRFHAAAPVSAAARPGLSFIVPLYNGAATVVPLVEDIVAEFLDERIEIILVNDGSHDDSEAVARRLVDRYPGVVSLVHFARNYGEHRAVLAGIRLARGEYTAVLDDDGQNPPHEVRRLREAARLRGWDVVYGCNVRPRHSRFRRLSSALHNFVADRLLEKPAGLYLSSFKLLNRFVADALQAERGGAEHLDGLVLGITRHVGQIDVMHRKRLHGRSNYTFGSLWRLWLDLALGYSTTLFKPAVFGGALTALASVAAFFMLLAWGAASVGGFAGAAAGCAFGLVLFYLGLLGESFGRLRAGIGGNASYVVRYVYRGDPSHG